MVLFLRRFRQDRVDCVVVLGNSVVNITSKTRTVARAEVLRKLAKRDPLNNLVRCNWR